MLLQGCMDQSACNFDENAEEDDGSCSYPANGFDCEGNCASGASALVLSLDDSYGDGWNANSLTIGGANYSCLMYMEILLLRLNGHNGWMDQLLMTFV